MSTRKSGRARAAGMVMVTLVALVLLATPALGQGTSGTLPDPISTGELLRYARRLRLSDQQQQAVQSFHDQYKEQFRILRDGDIAAFLRDMQSLQSSGMFPAKDDVQRVLTSMEKLSKKIEAVDRSFFDRIQSILTDEQLEQLPRARKARQRRRATASQMSFFQGQKPADLSDLILDIELTPEEGAAVDPILMGYESTLTRQLVKLGEATSMTLFSLFEELEERGIDQSTFEDPEKMGEAMKTIQEIMKDLGQEALELQLGIVKLNRRTMTSIAGAIDTRHARELRQAMVSKSYMQIAGQLAWKPEPYEKSLRSKKLTGAKREEVQALYDRVGADWDALVEESMTTMDTRNAEHSPFDMDMSWWQEQQEVAQAIGKRAADLRGQGEALLEEMLGDLFDVKMAQASRKAEDDALVAGSMVMVDPSLVERDDDAASDDESDIVWGADEFLPPKIGGGQLARYERTMKLDENQAAILQGLHEDYLEQFSGVEGNQIAALQEAQASLWQHDPDTGKTSSQATVDDIDEIYRHRRRALDAVRAVDAAFFDEIGEVIYMGEPSDRLGQVRLMRERETCLRGQTKGWNQFGGNEVSIDIVKLVNRQRLPDDAKGAVEPLLASYESDLADAFRRRFDAALESRRMMDRWGIVAMQFKQDEDSNVVDWGKRYQETVGDSQKQLQEADEAVVTLNHAAIDRIAAALSADQAWQLRSAYDQRAYPSVFKDPVKAHEKLAAAQALEDLTAQQRAQLEDLAAEYGPTYGDMCDRMVELSRSMRTPWMGSEDRADWTDFQERQNALTKLRFDRNELNSRAINQLSLALSDEQVNRIGGLPDLTLVKTKNWWE